MRAGPPGLLPTAGHLLLLLHGPRDPPGPGPWLPAAHPAAVQQTAEPATAAAQSGRRRKHHPPPATSHRHRQHHPPNAAGSTIRLQHHPAPPASHRHRRRQRRNRLTPEASSASCHRLPPPAPSGLPPPPPDRPHARKHHPSGTSQPPPAGISRRTPELLRQSGPGLAYRPGGLRLRQPPLHHPLDPGVAGLLTDRRPPLVDPCHQLPGQSQHDLLSVICHAGMVSRRAISYQA
jgi:hypothetical protein